MRRPILSHLGTGFMALILAVILWGFAYVENRQEVKVTFRIELVPPVGYQISPAAQNVELVISGPRRLVETFRGDLRPIRKQVNRTDVEQAGSVVITPEDVNADRRLRISPMPLRIVPVTISQEVEKALRVKFKTSGSPAPGYVFRPERSFVVPSTVLVKGPKELLEKPDAVIYTNTIEFAGDYPPAPNALIAWPASIQQTVDGKPVTVDTSRATVYIAFEEQVASRTFPDVPVGLLLPQGYAYKVSVSRTPAVKVTVEGPQQMLETLQSPSITVFAEVDASHTPRNLPYPRKLSVRLPAGLTGKADPDGVDLTVTAAEETGK